MKNIARIRTLLALAMAATPLVSRADIFFSDDFNHGSTLNQVAAAPGTNFTSYESAVGLAGGAQSISPGSLTLAFPITSSVLGEFIAKFAAAPKALTQPGDYIGVNVVFVNDSNVLSGTLNNNASLNIGLYNSGGVDPNQGHIVLNTGTLTGGTEDWLGFFGRVFYGQTGSILTRPAQTPNGTSSQNQDVLFSGASSSQSFNNPTGTGLGGGAPLVHLTDGATYTVQLVITLSNANTLTISNAVYAGTDTSATPLTAQQRDATGANFLTSGFDAFAVGWRNSGASQGSAMDISSVEVFGHTTVITTPPDITQQPVPVTVPNGGSCAFLVGAQGFSVTYQWHRFGTNLVDGGNISGANSDMLVISPASAADVASGANGYWVTVSGAGGFTTNSTTNSLSLTTAKSLVWNGPGAVWDLNSSANWLAGASASTFNFGDAVTINGNPPSGITLTGRYLSASSVTVAGSYSFGGTGSFAGPGSLTFNGSFLEIDNANTFTGGTILSNTSAGDLLLYLNNNSGLGTGPVTLATPGTMEVVLVGSASSGIAGDIVVNDDFTIQFDASGSFAGVMLGNLSGTPGKTLTLSPPPSATTTNRYRVYGTATVCDADINLVGNGSAMAIYDGTVLAPYQPSGGNQVYNGKITGNGGIVQRGSGTTILSGQSDYSGGTFPTTGTIGFGANTIGSVTSGPIGTGPLFLAPELPNVTGSGTVMASGGARSIANPIQYPSATNNLTLIIGGSNDLTFTGPFTLNGNDSTGTQTNRIIQVNNTAMTTFAGVISDGGAGFGLTKQGTGILALNNTETYTGPTTVSGGTLQVNGQLGSGAVTVASGGTLGGTGTVPGAVTVASGGTLSPGASIGTLTLNNNLTLNGNVFIEVNKSVSPSNDLTVVNGTLANTGTGTVTVSNLGPALVVGDRFQIFNKAVASGNTMTIAGGGPNVSWNNNLAGDGSISVASLTPPGPPVITTVNLSSGSLVFQGTNATGTAGGNYYVRSTTNLSLPRSSWAFEVTNAFGTGGAFAVTNPISAGVPIKFYILQLP